MYAIHEIWMIYSIDYLQLAIHDRPSLVEVLVWISATSEAANTCLCLKDLSYQTAMALMTRPF